MRHRIIVLLSALLSMAGSFAATADESFPTKPIRLIVPYPAGGTTDLMARILQQPLAKLLGQPIIIDNRAGAAGTIGAREVADAKPDGYTLLFSNNGPSSIAPLLQKDASYDPIKGFAPVALVSKAPLLLVAHPSVPGDSVASLIEYVKSQPDGVFYASAGPGSLGHLSTELFASRAGIKLNHVPYKGQAQTSLAVLSGDVKILLSTTSTAQEEYVKSGKLKLLGVASGETSRIAPGAVPIGKTVPGFSVEIWFGILAPAHTPSGVVTKLNEAIVTVLRQPDVQERFLGFGQEVAPGKPEDLARIIAAEVPEWRKIIAERGIRVD